MTSRSAAFYGLGGTLLVAWLAAANMPGDGWPSRERAVRPTGTPGAESLAGEVRSQADRLRTRMADAPVPALNPRNPFSFGAALRAARTVPRDAGTFHAGAAVERPLPPAPPLPALTLMGIAEETTGAGPRRTAIIAGDGDAIYMVGEGQPVGARYKVTKIGADAVELEDVVTHGYRRIAMR